MKNSKNKRRDFLMNVCPTVAMAFLGITVLESCSSGDDDVNNGGGSVNGGGNTGSNNGYSKDGNVVTINLSHSNFSSLQSNNWMNFTAQNMLLLKIDSSNYRAFDNQCPHEGNRGWSYSNGNFVCNRHSNSYKSDCSTPAANGNSGATNGSLKCYNTSLSGSTLKITL